MGRGLPAGNEPTFPLGENSLELEETEAAYVAWRKGIERFHQTGRWAVPKAQPEDRRALVTGASDDRSRYLRFQSPDDDADVVLVVRRWDDEHLALFLSEDSPTQGLTRATALLDEESARALVAAVTAFLGPS